MDKLGGFFMDFLCRKCNGRGFYLQEKGLSEANIRFDIIEILANKIRHIEAAFDATDFF